MYLRLDALILTREIELAGERTEFYERVRLGEFVALRRGVYMAADRWSALDYDQQYRARVHATVAFAGRPIVVSHISAASLWRLPLVGQLSSRVHAMGEIANGGRSSSVVSLHVDERPPSTATIDGITVTSLSRTVVDVARSCDFAQAVAIVDAALRRTIVPLVEVPETALTVDDLRAEAELVPMFLGSAKTRRVIEFANGDADRPGESISRVNMHLARLPAPELQAGIRGASGRLWHVDFWWPDFNLIGEFDGKTKYTDEQFLQGRTPQQALYEEKLREDDLRAARHGFTRWPWEVAVSMHRLRAQLVDACLR